MSDIHEIIVKKKFTFDDLLISIALSFAAIAIGVVVLMYQQLIYYDLIIWFLLVVGVVFVIQRRRTEWEFSLVGKELFVDKISGKSRRKRLCNIDIEYCTHIGSLDEFSEYESQVTKTFECVSSMNNEENIYFIVYRGNADCCALFFEPSEDMLSAMKNKAPRKFNRDKI